MSLRLSKVPSDPILGIVSKFKADKNPKKINLSIGEYLLNGELYKFNCVAKAEKLVNLNHRYLPIEGNNAFLEEHSKIILPERNSTKDLLKYQTISGTGALNLSGVILKKLGFTKIFLPNLTWPNHMNIYSACGFEIDSYDYLKLEENKEPLLSNLDDLKDKIVKSEKNTCFLFQANGNNPTGLNYTDSMIKELVPILKEHNKLVIVDNAYQGLSSKCYKEDVKLISELDFMRVPMMIASSCAKNLGLYGQRLGSLICALYEEDEEILDNLNSNIKKMIREIYSSPPKYGSQIAQIVFSTFKTEWKKECKELVNNLEISRKLLYEELKKENIIWNNLLQSEGLFYLSPLKEEEIEELAKKHSIYILKNGRINIAGLNHSDIPYFAECLKDIFIK